MSRTPTAPTAGHTILARSLPPFPLHVSPAVIEWRDGTPFSPAFNDIYFSLSGGPEETRHVFITNNDLPARFSAHDLRSFTIAETGFGTGLNFLVAAQAFIELAPPDATLHFVSVEKFPLAPADLERAHAHWPEFADLAKELQALMPPSCSGFHHRILAGGRVRLTLLLGDAAALLRRLDAQVDGWFLDGFAPAKNGELWNAELFAQVRRLSAPGATFATFTAAGDVRRGLTDAGFCVEKVPGFGRKREMLRGRHEINTSNKNPSEDAQAACDTRCNTTAHATSQPPERRVAIIGGGLAGCASARAFAERGWQVTLFERNAQLADETSGNLAGAVYPKFSPHETAQNRWYRDSYLFALARLPQILGEPDGTCWSRCGLLQLEDPERHAAETNAKATRESSASDSTAPSPANETRWPLEVFKPVAPAETTTIAGMSLEKSGTWFAGAAWVNPPSLCRALAGHPAIRVLTNTAAQPESRDDGMFVNGEPFDAVVVANALAATLFPVTAALPLRPVRGQVTHVSATASSEKLRCIVCHEGYVTPARNGIHCVGATFGPRDRDSTVRATDHHENLQKLNAACPSLFEALGGQHAEVVGGRTGFRTQTPDYLPVIGRVGEHSDRANNVFVLAALGAKGIAFSLLGAEIIAALANNEPLPVDTEVAEAVDPARFQQRAQRRKQQQRPQRAPDPARKDDQQ